MSSHPLSAWLDLVQAALPAFRQYGAEVPAAQAFWAQHVKSTLELRKEIDALNKATSFALLQVQLGMLGATAPGTAAQALLDVQADTLSGLVAQAKAQMGQAAARGNALLADLRQAESQDDVPLVLAGFLRDADSTARKAAGDAAMLLSSAHAAADMLVHRMLDALIAPQPTQP